MAFGPSSYVKKMHGYQENKPPLNVTGTFLSVCIYQLNGIQEFDDNKHIVDSLDENAKFGIGNNINELCFMLFNKTLDQMYEKEEMLTKGKHPPYLVTVTTDNDEYTYQCEWTQWYNESLLSVLYDHPFDKEYIDNKKSMRDNNLKFIPLIIYSLSSPDIPVTATLLNDYFYLVLPEEKLCQATTFQLNLEGGAICKKISSDFSIKELVSKYRPLSSKVSRLILDAMQENDNLKKFLFSWQALETLVKETFETVKNVKKFPDTEKIPVDYRESVDELYKNDNKRKIRDRRKIRDVAPKFIYLSIYQWKIPHDRHYDLFDKSRKFRNDFIHEPLKYPEMAALFPSYSYNNFLIINNIIRSMLK